MTTTLTREEMQQRISELEKGLEAYRHQEQLLLSRLKKAEGANEDEWIS